MDETAIITREELAEFKEIAKKEYDVELTDNQAFEQATALLNLADHILKKTLVKKTETSRK